MIRRLIKAMKIMATFDELITYDQSAFSVPLSVEKKQTKIDIRMQIPKNLFLFT